MTFRCMTRLTGMNTTMTDHTYWKLSLANAGCSVIFILTGLAAGAGICAVVLLLVRRLVN